MKLTNKTVWITGASSGIGKGLALALSKKGCKLILSGRNMTELEKVKALCPQSEILAFDLADYKSAPQHAAKAIELFGHVDLLINNGGISQRSLLIETDIEVDKKLMEVDYLGTIALTKAILPHFVSRKSGHFATVTSIMGKFGSPYRSGYCGAKHALHGFFDVLRMEHDRDNVGVTILCPGFVATNVAKNALTGDGSQQQTDDNATQNGLPVDEFAKRAIRAIESAKHEAYIGRSEIRGVYLKRFFPKLLHKVVLKSAVR
jgi:dehydrogenase/reductase SDR family protein 7